MKRIVLTVALAVCVLSSTYADIPSPRFIDIPWPNPGPPPTARSSADVVRWVVGGVLLSLAIISFGLRAHTKNWRREFVAAMVLLVFAALLISTRVGPDPREQRRYEAQQKTWKLKHDAWLRGDTVKKRVPTPPFDQYPEEHP